MSMVGVGLKSAETPRKVGKGDGNTTITNGT